MPRRLYPRPLIYEQLAAERLFDPLRDTEVQPMGRHDDLDGDGVADQAAPLPHDDGVDDTPYTVINPDQFERG